MILLLFWEWRLLLEIIIRSVLVVIHVLVIRQLVRILGKLVAKVVHFEIMKFILEASALVRTMSPKMMPMVI